MRSSSFHKCCNRRYLRMDRDSGMNFKTVAFSHSATAPSCLSESSYGCLVYEKNTFRQAPPYSTQDNAVLQDDQGQASDDKRGEGGEGGRSEGRGDGPLGGGRRRSAARAGYRHAGAMVPELHRVATTGAAGGKPPAVGRRCHRVCRMSISWRICWRGAN